MRHRKPLRCAEEYSRAMSVGGCGKRYEKYRPMLTVRDVPSDAMKSRVFLLRFGRMFHCFSDGEHSFLLMLDWDDQFIEVREQYPLDPSLTLQLAEENDIPHPGYTLQPKYRVMTTDFLVTVRRSTGNGCIAYQIKDRRESLSKRAIEKIWLEQQYWAQKGVYSEAMMSSEFNKDFCSNLKKLAIYRNTPVSTEVLLRLSAMAAPLLEKGDCPLSNVQPCISQHVPNFGVLGGAQIVKLLTAKKLWECKSLRKKPLSQCEMSNFTIVRA